MGKREQLLEIMEDAAKGETKATLRARIAALEAQLAEAKDRNDKLHRRCQIAECLHQSVVGTLEMWSRVCDRKDFDTLLFWYALQDMLKAKKSAEQRLSALEAAPPAPTATEADMDDAAVAALVALARHNIPTDIQELLVRGDPMRSIPPGALSKSFAAALKALTAAQEAGKP